MTSLPVTEGASPSLSFFPTFWVSSRAWAAAKSSSSLLLVSFGFGTSCTFLTGFLAMGTLYLSCFLITKMVVTFFLVVVVVTASFWILTAWLVVGTSSMVVGVVSMTAFMLAFVVVVFLGFGVGNSKVFFIWNWFRLAFRVLIGWGDFFLSLNIFCLDLSFAHILLSLAWIDFFSGLIFIRGFWPFFAFSASKS